MSNFARKFLPHRLWDTAINNVMYAVKTPYMLLHQFMNNNIYTASTRLHYNTTSIRDKAVWNHLKLTVV